MTSMIIKRYIQNLVGVKHDYHSYYRQIFFKSQTRILDILEIWQEVGEIIRHIILKMFLIISP